MTFLVGHGSDPLSFPSFTITLQQLSSLFASLHGYGSRSAFNMFIVRRGPLF